MLTELLLCIALLLFVLHWRTRSYWYRRGIFSVEGEFIFGNTRKILFNKTDFVSYLDHIYKKYKEKKLIGIYSINRPLLVVTDLEYIKSILVSDFNSFADQLLYYNSWANPLILKNPFLAAGEKWKESRGIHIAMLTISKIKEYFPMMVENNKSMVEYIQERKTQPIKVMDLSKFYTIGNTISIAYGYESDVFKNPENGFRKYAKDLMAPEAGAATTLGILAPRICDILQLRIIPKSVNDFFIEFGKEVKEFRGKNNLVRNDVIQHLCKTEQKRIADGKPGFSSEDMGAHLQTAYFDSVESSSAILAFHLLQLAGRPDIQERIREEIQLVSTNLQDLTMEKVNSINYLSMFFNEIMRTHPLLPFYSRTCTKSTRLGDTEIEKGTRVIIPYKSILNDPEYYHDPGEFNPNRFAEENFNNNMQKSFFPFGVGPRQCIGMKYGSLQVKLAIISILLKYRIKPLKTSEEQNISSKVELISKPSENEAVIFEEI